jgi:hypothetical protein
MPQYSNILQIAQGRDWKGDKLQNPDGTDYTPTQQAGEVMKTLFESTVPAYAVPNKVLFYGKDPSKLLNPIRLKRKTPAQSPDQFTKTAQAKRKKLLKQESKPSGSGDFVLPDLDSSSSDFVLPDLP